MALSVVILAAGKGTRMQSALPKVLHPVAGKAMVQHVIDAAAALAPESVTLVYGHGGDVVREAVSGELNWAQQAEQLGTGHAVLQAMPHTQGEVVLILYGDVPLTRPETLQRFVALADENTLALMTVTLNDPSGYGRIVRENGQVVRIVEQKDASEAELGICEINTGILAVPRTFLNQVLPTLGNSNAQGEYYLTDVIALAVQAGLAVKTAEPDFSWEVDGVNDRVQLARLERIYQQVQAEALMRAGVTLADPSRLDIRGNIVVGRDLFIDANVLLEGEVSLGNQVRIGAGWVIRNSRIADKVEIEPYTLIDGAVIAEGAHLGPFARIRPGTEIAADAKVGNFVETKNTRLGEGAKANHLSYLGDADIGAHSNVGAGTITCNYDGVNKSKTVIGEHAFIGSNSSLVAPLEIGDGATVGAGSVITSKVNDNELAVARGKQRNIANWQRPVKRK